MGSQVEFRVSAGPSKAIAVLQILAIEPRYRCGLRLALASDRLSIYPGIQPDCPLVALAYRYRWSVELFFRWLKCVLGCRHLLGESFHAVQIQVYAALVARLLLVAWTHKKPNKRTFEMLCFYFSGWATEDEVQHHIAQLPTASG